MTTPAKTPIEIRDAFFEWLTSVGIGVLPLLSHLMIHTVNPASQNTSSEGWTVDVLFVAIATAGTSIASVFARFAKGSYRTVRLGPSAIFLMTVTILLLTLSAMEYGVVACGQISSASLGMATALRLELPWHPWRSSWESRPERPCLRWTAARRREYKRG